MDDQFNRTLDQGYLQNSLDNFIGVQRIDQKVRSMDDLFQLSICRCRRCWNKEKDAVFWNGEIEDQFAYPPYGKGEKIDHTPDTYYWVCPECFEAQMKIIERREKEEYYYFREYDIRASLKELGIDKPEDIEKYIEEVKREEEWLGEGYFETSDKLKRKSS